ncbi:Stage III sporulation protein AB [Geobacillus thermoleovorans CCB_US3_UF5]|uniref:Stage III sporulation protein SpoAB n=2 Tax=Geobacillus thermoleovorans TaxID=33941 RepID=A0A2Z3NCK5_GEOTH|nr:MULTISPECIES: stage III sporulation protein SpoIIIAB [Geobacillus]AEV20020.1 Stage III sporulation protein AB [Geobacillus thermoleovorans CCB_US3_UF5]AWO75459.1 stage III sporulation protein SpoAB [Geobacillus thermoleovorans]MED3667643.1 stage III sporulation protein SpoIIIAB [Geobacillus kaustophilus]MED4972563.1 stage III sporulation protein SpoIIIAB [Geobacillus thermoleovorans]OQP14929.1 stage III sporulation protein SpoAB [Geobacillus thermoleovorans]
MKWFGALLILAASTWLGFAAARVLHERPLQLRQLKAALRALEAEVMYGHTPLADAAMHLARQTAAPLSELFERFAAALCTEETSAAEAWEKSLRAVWGKTALKQGEFEVMKQFGATLGQYDRLTQQRQIALALAHLEREEAEALDNQARYAKMAKSLGVLAGLLLVILLM